MEIKESERQAATEFCIARIAHLERCIEEYPGHPAIKVDLLVLKVALASLTAEPEYNISYEGGEVDLEVSKARYDACHPSYRWISYEAPPAQILRPVDLPQAFAYTIEGMEEYIDGWWLRKGDVIEALRQHGYEVKS